MGETREPGPVKPVACVLYSDETLAARARTLLRPVLGAEDCSSAPFDFDFTDYYQAEMGKSLKRVFLSFDRLIHPGRLADLKASSNAIEAALASEAGNPLRRPVNIDPGCLDLSKVVLASTKDRFQRIYIGNGIYAEPTLAYVKGEFRPFSWTYPDMRTDEIRAFFGKVRGIYERQIRNHASPG